MDLSREWRESDAASEEARCKHGLPFEDFEGETCGDGADEAECWVLLPEDVLVEVREAVVADGGCELREEVEGPGIAFGEVEVSSQEKERNWRVG